MSQHSFNISDEPGAAFLADVNNALEALASQSAGAVAPTTTYPYQIWTDTSTTPATIRIRNGANTAWVVLGTADVANLGNLPIIGGTVSGAVQYSGPAASTRYHGFQTAGVQRWYYGVDNSAESGANAGSNFIVARYSDAGAWIDTPFSIGRQNGVMTLQQRPVFNGATPWDSANLVTPFDTANGALSFRNKLINGNFDFWQRGTSLAADSTGLVRYLADRWFSGGNGSSMMPSRQSFALGQGVVPNEPTFFQRCSGNAVAGAGNYTILAQKIEGVRTLAGQSAVLSFWAKADSPRNMAVEFTQEFGTGGAPTAFVVAIGVKTLAVTTVWQKFTVNVTLPSIAGATLGTNGDDGVRVNFWFEAGSNYNSRTNSLGQPSGGYYFDIAQVQLEPGNAATPFGIVARPVELMRCQRYYEKSFPIDTAPAQNIGAIGATYFGQYVAASATQRFNEVGFAVRKRAAAAVALYNPLAANAQVRNSDINADWSGAAATAGDRAIYLYAVSPAGSGVGQTAVFHWTADAEI